jgi:arsenate reductase
MALTLWHNPRCSKSRAALAAGRAGVEHEMRLYLKTPPSPQEVLALAARIGRPLREILGPGTPYREAESRMPMTQRWHGRGREPDPAGTPVLDTGTRAVIGRPPEAF